MNDLFGALDVTSIPEFPDDGTHEYVIKYPPKIVQTSSGNKKLVIEFFLDDEESPFNGKKFAKWFNLPWVDEGVSSVEEFDAKMIQAFGMLKEWLINLNVPEDEIATFDFGELTGTRVLGYGYKRDRYNSSGQEYFIKNVKVV